MPIAHPQIYPWCCLRYFHFHYDDVIMTTIASQITSLTSVYSTVYSDADQRKHQSSASLAFVWGIHRDRWIPRTKGQLRGKCFHLMTSSCVWDLTVAYDYNELDLLEKRDEKLCLNLTVVDYIMVVVYDAIGTISRWGLVSDAYICLRIRSPLTYTAPSHYLHQWWIICYSDVT